MRLYAVVYVRGDTRPCKEALKRRDMVVLHSGQTLEWAAKKRAMSGDLVVYDDTLTLAWAERAQWLFPWETNHGVHYALRMCAQERQYLGKIN
jgi:hypothetical protein